MKQKSPHFFTGISTLWAKSKVGISAVENSAAGGNVRTQLVELVWKLVVRTGGEELFRVEDRSTFFFGSGKKTDDM